MDILETPSRNAHARAQDRPRHVLVHLPPGPSLKVPAFNVQPRLNTLLSPNTSIVTIHYRLGLDTDATTDEKTCFPTPIHDVSTALSYLTSSTSPFNEGQHEEPKICLFGSHIGGGLATMLSLTHPDDVHALAVIEPLVDWVSLDEIVEQLRRTKDTARKRHKHRATRFGVDDSSVLAAAEDLIRLRARLFPTPSSYFDPFASPLLFLRAPGRDTPLNRTVGDDLVEEMGLNDSNGGFGDTENLEGDLQEEYYSSHAPLPDTMPTPLSTTQSQSPPRRRKVLQRWPAIGRPESAILPHVKAFVRSPLVVGSFDEVEGNSDGVHSEQGHAALMRAQGSELVELMRRACFFGREKGFAEERVRLYEETAHDQDMGSESAEALTTSSHSRPSMRLHEQALSWAETMLAKD
ncbi:hypothetical protein H2204_005850 [Knufia peltigerae]|uniref:Alpha/beta hydrolase fold-3 domain-containing protein n=1 Tax=Knufia peltigerae TaxID=1002370 RepID=A0AA39CY39_9EURO|nr:hypothetical protein H2204_005850 [Knufia peltigerae]